MRAFQLSDALSASCGWGAIGVQLLQRGSATSASHVQEPLEELCEREQLG
jgi:hypothetical protein